MASTNTIQIERGGDLAADFYQGFKNLDLTLGLQQTGVVQGVTRRSQM